LLNFFAFQTILLLDAFGGGGGSGAQMLQQMAIGTLTHSVQRLMNQPGTSNFPPQKNQESEQPPVFLIQLPFAHTLPSEMPYIVSGGALNSPFHFLHSSFSGCIFAPVSLLPYKTIM